MQEDNGAVLVLVSASPVVYQLRYPNGSMDVYSQSDGSTSYPRNVFLRQRIDPAGNAVTLNYDDQMRLTSLNDASGGTTTFSYQRPSHPLLITQVTDPFVPHRQAELHNPRWPSDRDHRCNRAYLKFHLRSVLPGQLPYHAVWHHKLHLRHKYCRWLLRHLPLCPGPARLYRSRTVRPERSGHPYIGPPCKRAPGEHPNQ